jgi:hypothetical protein
MKMQRIYWLATILLFIPAIAYADTGVPMLALLWPASWVLFIPIVVIEAWVARRILELDWQTSLKKTGIANAVSTLIGIPLTWGALVIVEIMLSQGGRAYGINTLSGKIIAVTVQAPWLIPYESDLDWMIPAASIVLLIPFFFVSVFIERWIFGRKSQLNKAKVKSWSWKANLLSYALLQAVLICFLIYSIATKHHAETDKSQSISSNPVDTTDNTRRNH